MKGALGCLGVIAAMFVLLLGVTWWVIARTPDQSGLTQQVDLELTGSQKQARSGNRSGHTVTYAYRFEGERFTNQTWISNSGWMPGEALSACVDPDQPEEHVLRTEGTEVCGDNFVGFTVETADLQIAGTWVPQEVPSEKWGPSFNPKKATITFDNEGEWTANDGCNDLGGEYAVDGDDFDATGDFVGTGCLGGLVPYDQIIMRDAERVDVSGDQLEIFDDDDQLLIRLVRE